MRTSRHRLPGLLCHHHAVDGLTDVGAHAAPNTISWAQALSDRSPIMSNDELAPTRKGETRSQPSCATLEPRAHQFEERREGFHDRHRRNGSAEKTEVEAGQS